MTFLVALSVTLQRRLLRALLQLEMSRVSASESTASFACSSVASPPARPASASAASRASVSASAAAASHPPSLPPPAGLNNAFVRGGRLSRSPNRCHHTAFRFRLPRQLRLLCLRSVVMGPRSRTGLLPTLITLLRLACNRPLFQLCCRQVFCVRIRASILPAQMSVVAEITRESDVRTAAMPARPVTHEVGNIRLC